MHENRPWVRVSGLTQSQVYILEFAHTQKKIYIAQPVHPYQTPSVTKRCQAFVSNFVIVYPLSDVWCMVIDIFT